MGVQSKVAELGLEVNELNISDPSVAEALVEKGGKRQVPFLVDDEKNVSMYESGDIIEYLSKGKEGAEETKSEEKALDSGVCPVE